MAMKWLHRVGYVTTAIVAILALRMVQLAWQGHREMQRTEAIAREESRTREGALTAEREATAVGLAAGLPKPEALAGDGFRFVAMPSFGDQWYALAVWKPKDSNEAAGMLIGWVRDPRENTETPREPQSFAMPAAAYAAMMTSFDRLADGWPGDGTMCLDGTPVAFERVRGARIVSGSGSASCTDHYKALSAIVLRGVKPFAPLGSLEVDSEWMPRHLGNSRRK
jgi:hypothetical protein